MDFYAQARLLTGMFSRWPDFQMNLYDHDAKLQPELDGIHCHESYEIRVPLNPEGDPSGPLELYLPGVMHYGYPENDLDGSFSISFEPLILRYRGEQSCFFTSPYEERLTEVFAGLKKGGAIPAAQREECRLLFNLLFLQAQPAAAPAHSNSVELMGYYINHHYYRSDFSIRELARQFGYSPNYVQRCFRKMFDHTPREHLLETRMKAAVRFMQSKPYRIKELAAMCGFQDVHHFSKTFRRYYGVSPSGYLNQRKQDRQN